MASRRDMNSVVSLLWSQSSDKLRALSSLTNNHERIEYAYSSHIFDNVFDIVPSGCHGKSFKMSEQIRNEGNRLFKLKRYKDALQRYSESIILAPFPQVENGSTLQSANTKDSNAALSVTFSNRSAALFHLNMYKSCLKEVEYSLETGYPVNQIYKLHERAARCHVALSHWEEAVATFKAALRSLDESALESPAKEKWSLSIKRELEKISECVSGKQNDSATKNSEMQASDLPKLTGGTHSELPSACNLISQQFNETFGRFLVANAPLQPGDVVFSEKPYVAILHAQFYKSHCFHCLIPVSLPFPCQQCSEVIYCSKECQSLSWPLHWRECTNLSLLSGELVYKLGHLALRTVILAPHEMLQSTEVLRSHNAANSDYCRFCQLVTHERDRDSFSTVQLVAIAVYLTEVLKMVQFLKDLEQKTVCQHILHALQVIQCNGIAVSQMSDPEDFHQSTPQEIGQAVYLTQALINHSCDPNMELCFYGNHCIARVIKVIEAGDQMFYDYGVVFLLHPRSERQKYLRENYYFTCNCVACQHDWPVFNKINDSCIIFKCQKCKQPLAPLGQSETLTCTGCGEQLATTTVIGQLSESHDQWALSAKQASISDLLETLPVLVRHLELLDQFIYQPWKEYYSCQAMIRQCYRLLGARYGRTRGISY